MEIIANAGAECRCLEPYGELEVTGIGIDSRIISRGEIFVALDGTVSRGIDHAQDAVDKGASLIICSHRDAQAAATLPVPVCLTTDPIKAAGEIARIFFKSFRPDFELWGVTGTNGKTTVTYLMDGIFRALGITPGIIGTIEQRMPGRSEPSSLTTPDMITLHRLLGEMQDRGAKRVVMEVSSHALSQGRVAGCKFSVAIFTNLSRDHLDYHIDMEQYFRAKATMFTDLKPDLSVINIDDEYGIRLWDMVSGKKISYGFAQKADVRPLWWNSAINGMAMKIKTPSGTLPIFSKLSGRHNVMNILAAVAASIGSGMKHGRISCGIESVDMVPGRLQPIDVNVPVKVFVDYAHTPAALETVLQSLKELLNLHDMRQKNRLICIIGCGGDRDRGKRSKMGKIAASIADILILTSDNPRSESPHSIIAEMKSSIPANSKTKLFEIVDRREAIKKAAEIAEAGDVVLVAGKGHETYQVINGIKRPFNDAEETANAFALYCKHEKFHDITDTVYFASVSDILFATGGTLVSGKPDISFPSISTDSRKLLKNELFWALNGENFHGSDFAASALAAGASGVVIPKDYAGHVKSLAGKKQFVVAVDDTTTALGDFAAWHIRRHDIKVLGITGSCGKTGTKEIVSAILEKKFKTVSTPGNFNNLVGLPLSIFQAGPDTEWAVLEMGMNRPGEIQRLCEIAGISAGIITSILPAHLMGVGGIEDIFIEKREIWKMMPADKPAILNLDDPMCVKAASDAGVSNITAFSLCMSSADAIKAAKYSKATKLVRALSFNLSHEGTALELETEDGRFTLRSKVAGMPGARNMLCATSAAIALGIEMETIQQSISAIEPAKGRLHIQRIENGILIDDSYNASPASMAAAIDFLAAIGAGAKTVAILGDMLELGKEEEKYHRANGRYVAEKKIDMLICVGRLAGFIAESAVMTGMSDKKVRAFSSAERLFDDRTFQQITQDIKKPCAILVKGSRGMRMERVSEQIKEKGGVN